MISNYQNFNINNKDVKIREISFYEFKNLCKKLYTSDTKNYGEIFVELFNETIKGDNLNYIEKFYALLLLRNFIHGTNFSFTLNGIQTNLNMNTILEKINFDNKNVLVKVNEYTLVFGIPNNLVYNSIDTLIVDSLLKVVLKDKEIYCNNFSFEERKKIIDESSIPIFETYKNILANLEDLKINIFKNLDIQLTDGTLIDFLKSIFLEDIQVLYKFEFFCIRSLHLNALDFEKYTYPELKIFLRHLSDEAKKNTQQVE
jgi:hypothetical protein